MRLSFIHLSVHTINKTNAGQYSKGRQAPYKELSEYCFIIVWNPSSQVNWRGIPVVGDENYSPFCLCNEQVSNHETSNLTIQKKILVKSRCTTVLTAVMINSSQKALSWTWHWFFFTKCKHKRHYSYKINIITMH